jgi:hypothetical protein
MSCSKRAMGQIWLYIVLFVVVPSGWMPGGTVSVLLPSGAPAAKAMSASLRSLRFVEIRNGNIVKPLGQPLSEVRSDGRFEVPEAEFGRFVFLHPQGWADEDIGAETREIRLQPWNEISGRVIPSAGEVSRVTFFQTEPWKGASKDSGAVYWTSKTTVNADRTFTLGFLPSGRGVYGVERGYSFGSRTFRWSDYLQEIQLPVAGLVSLGETGLILRGRLPRSIVGPAIIEVNDRTWKRPAFFGVTDASGAFAIPGLVPGDFRVTARPLDEGLGKYHSQREFSISADVREFDLGELPEPAPDVEVFRQIEYPDGLAEKIRAEAIKKSPQPIRRIWLGQLLHPADIWGARVTYVPVPIDATHAMARTLVVQVPSETILKFYPEHDVQGYGSRLRDGAFLDSRLIEETVRTFPLSSQTLYLPLPEDLKYETVLALLKAIEAKSWKTPPPQTRRSEEGRWVASFSSGAPSLGPDDLSRIDSLRREKNGGRIHVHTRDGDFRGRSAEFEEKNGEFILVGGSYWRA